MVNPSQDSYNSWAESRITSNMSIKNLTDYNEDDESHPLNSLLSDTNYNKIDLMKNSPSLKINNIKGNVDSTLNDIEKVEKDINDMESYRLHQEEKLKMKERITYSALLNLFVLAFFIIICIITILINNEALYGITFVLLIISATIKFSIM